MRWDDERYVRVYTRDTPTWCLLSWEARSIFLLLLRVVDRAGILHLGRAGARAVAAVLRAPEDVVNRALAELTEDGCLQVKATWLVIPNFTAAQETPQNDAARKRASREKAKARAMEDVSGDLPEHAASGPVTPSHSDLICADPIRSDRDPLLRAHARGAIPEPEQEPHEPPPLAKDRPRQPQADPLPELRHDPPEVRSQPLVLPGAGDHGRHEGAALPTEEPLTLGETYAAVEVLGAPGELDDLARELAGDGNAFGLRCLTYLDSGTALPSSMRAKLREIRDERAKPRQSGIRRTLTLTAEEQALVAAYVAAQKRYRKVEVPHLELHGRAAQKAIGDLQTLARSLRREGFEPTALDVWEHKLEQYFCALKDARLDAQGNPMQFVLARTDGLDLPRPKRARERPPPGPALVQADPRPTPEEIRAAGAKYGWSEEVIEREIARTGT